MIPQISHQTSAHSRTARTDGKQRGKGEESICVRRIPRKFDENDLVTMKKFFSSVLR